MLPTAVLLICCVAPTTGQAAEFNARISDDDIALNEVVQLDFATTMPTKPEVDIAATVRRSLEMREVANRWRLVAPPAVFQHERAKDVHVTVQLMPVRPGTLEAPRIPVDWLDGKRVAEFGTVNVRPAVVYGGKDLPLPKEIDGVGGFTWGLSTEEFTERTGKEAGRDAQVRLANGLTLGFAGGHLASAELPSPGLSFTQARPTLMERWGTPAVDDEQGTIWHLGWITIQATGDDERTTLAFTHNGVRLGANRSKVRNQVFDVLDATGSQPSADQAEATDAAGADDQAAADAEAEAAPPAEATQDDAEPKTRRTTGDGPDQEDFEAEFDRALKKNP